jgi:hypothetical protein
MDRNYYVTGQGGANEINSGAGNDWLLGGARTYRFVCYTANWGQDVPMDFSVTDHDLIVFDSLLFADFAVVQSALCDGGGYTYVDCAVFDPCLGIESTVLFDVATASLIASEFNLVWKCRRPQMMPSASG